VTNGLGGGEPTSFDLPRISGSEVGISEDIISAVRLTATSTRFLFQMETTGGQVRDTFELTKPIITTTALPAGTQGSFYDQTLAVTGGGGGNQWDHTVGSLPPGLSLSSSGRISGTPTGTGAS